MRDFLLDAGNDIVIADRDLATVDDPDAIAQNVRQRLAMFTNEWFLNLGEGTPWFEDILIKGQRQFVVEDILKTRIRDTPGITDLTDFELVESGERAISVTFIATTATGATIEDIVELSL